MHYFKTLHLRLKMYLLVLRKINIQYMQAIFTLLSVAYYNVYYYIKINCLFNLKKNILTVNF